jgi:hypothetical protein
VTGIWYDDSQTINWGYLLINRGKIQVGRVIVSPQL